LKNNVLLIAVFIAIAGGILCVNGFASGVAPEKISVTASPQSNTVNSESAAYYPMDLGNVLYLKGFKKNNPSKTLLVKAEVKSVEKRDGVEYTYFYAPQVNVRYFVRRDESGVYMKIMRYPFPFFGFPIEIELTPEMKFVSFPLKEGVKWIYKGKAEAVIFGLRIGRDINTDFEIIAREKLETEAGSFDSYHILAMVDEGDGKGKRPEKYWYAKGLGYSRADTSGHFAELTGFRVWSPENNAFIEKLPEGEKNYE